MSNELLSANLERYIDLASTRERVASTNIANLDTPGYHAKQADFASILISASDDDTATTPVRIRDEGGLIERADGNDVDEDREGMMLAKAQLEYSLGVQLIKGEFHEELSAITAGGGAS